MQRSRGGEKVGVWRCELGVWMIWQCHMRYERKKGENCSFGKGGGSKPDHRKNEAKETWRIEVEEKQMKREKKQKGKRNRHCADKVRVC